MIPTEVLLMIKAAGGSRRIGQSAAIGLLDWYDLGGVHLLVMEKPDHSKDLYNYLFDCGGVLEEAQAKV